MKHLLFVLSIFPSVSAIAGPCDQELKSLNQAIRASDQVSQIYARNISNVHNYVQTIAVALKGAEGKPVRAAWSTIILKQIEDERKLELENLQSASKISTALHVRFSELQNCINK